MAPFLALDARGVEPDPLDVLVYLAGELAVLRETVGAMGARRRRAGVGKDARQLAQPRFARPEDGAVSDLEALLQHLACSAR